MAVKMFNQEEKRKKREVMKKKTLFWLIFFLVFAADLHNALGYNENLLYINSCLKI